MTWSRPEHWALLVVFALVASSLAAGVAAQGPPDDTPGPDDNPGQGDDGSDDGSHEADDRGRGPPDHAGPPAGVGRAEVEDGHVEGSFLAFDVADDGIANFSLGGVAVFDAVRVDDLEIEEVRADGARVRVEGEAGDADVEFRLHDTPTGSSQLEVDDDATLEFDLADGANVTKVRDSRLRLDAGDLRMHIWRDEGTFTLDNGTFLASGDADVRLVSASGSGPSGQIGRQVAQAAADGRVGGEVRMISDRGGMRSEVATFTNLSAIAAPSDDGVMVVVESRNKTGRTVVLHADRQLLGNASADPAVRFDGENISRADDLQDVLSVDPGEDPESVVVAGASAVQVLVSVPSFSAHTIEVASVGPVLQQIGLSPQQAAAAFAAAAGTVVVAALVAGKRR